MNKPLIIAAVSLIVASCDVSEDIFTITGPTVIGECTVPPGTKIRFVGDVVREHVGNGDCLAIPAGSMVTITSGAARILFPDGRALVVPVQKTGRERR